MSRQTKGADRTAWDATFATYQRAKVEFDRLWSLYNDAEEKLPGRVDYYFDELHLGMGMKRENVVRSIIWALCEKEFGKASGVPLHPRERGEAYQAKLQTINAEAERLADEFMAYQERNKAERARLCVSELQDEASAYGHAHFFPAREALMTTPAPDAEALLVKLELAATWVDDPFVDAALADAKRLFGNGRA